MTAKMGVLLILTNYILSSPDILSPSYELTEIFLAK